MTSDNANQNLIKGPNDRFAFFSLYQISDRPLILQSHDNLSRLDKLLRPKLGKPRSVWKTYDRYWVKGNTDTDASVMTGVTVEPYLGRCISWLMRHFDSPKLQTRLYHVFWSSVQSHTNRPHLSPPPQNGGVFRRRDLPTTDSNHELIASLVEEKRNELTFESVEYKMHYRVSKEAPDVLLRAYDEWSTCSRDGDCNAHFTATSLLYLSERRGLIGLKHCVDLIKEHLTHPDNNDYNIIIPPGVHAPFEAHIVAVTEDEEVLSASELDGDLYWCAKLLLNKDQLCVTLGKRAMERHLRNLHDEQTQPQLGDALWMAKMVSSNIPNLPRYTLPYLPQILHFLLKKASLLPTRSQHVCLLMTDMSRHLKELNRFGVPIFARQDYIRAFITVAIQEFHEYLTTESGNGHRLDSYPEILAFIHGLQDSAAPLDVVEDRKKWQDILKQCGLENTPSHSVPSLQLEGVEINLPMSKIREHIARHHIDVFRLFQDIQQNGTLLDVALADLVSENSPSGSLRGSNRNFLGVLCCRNGENDIEMMPA
ncbi:hypothetical protein EDD18DRAFT_1465345 [Armillaria luteobubalina]|uniref:Uncharacterized protein n=1 Tax=Armillaria luteobubalina TaxID=153913 RepID=A0AA39PYE2_9AGAR|nr:hypothetical protein EDD18DRAFT_1465345 [Armillaria luteobubalina]